MMYLVYFVVAYLLVGLAVALWHLPWMRRSVTGSPADQFIFDLFFGPIFAVGTAVWWVKRNVS